MQPDLNLQIRMATVLMLCFIAEHNLPFMIMDHFSDLCKVMFPDSPIAQGIHMKRTKASEMAKKLGSAITEDLVDRLRKNPFSVIIDETTDVSRTKVLTVVVKFYDMEDGYIKTKMLDLVDTYDWNNNDVGSSGESLYNMIIETFNHHQIPHANFIGFAADTTSNMMGNSNSVASRLRQNFPGITIFKCICHSLHLCASEAARQLPRACEALIRNVHNYFSHSAKRIFEFNQFRDFFFEEEHHNMLQPSQTRWLSLAKAVERTLKQWDDI